MFPFKYKGVSYSKCTTVESDNDVPWCAIDIQPNTEVPQDGKHWGDCEFDCPGGGKKKIRMKIYILHDIYESVHVLIILLEYPCDEQQLFNIRGKCVAQAEERIRIARPYAHEFRSGLNDTNTVRKCSEEHPYGIYFGFI